MFDSGGRVRGSKAAQSHLRVPGAHGQVDGQGNKFRGGTAVPTVEQHLEAQAQLVSITTLITSAPKKRGKPQQIISCD